MLKHSKLTRSNTARTLLRVALFLGATIFTGNLLMAQDAPFSIGVAARGSFTYTKAEEVPSLSQFNIDNARLFFSAPVMKNVKIVLNTDYSSITNNVQLMDAMGQFSFSPKVNFWAGRFLPPSDRANLYGPFYSHSWAIYTDGVQDGYPQINQGRDNGFAYFGDFKKVKLSGGIYDGLTATGIKTPIKAGRVQIDLWDAEESGYYLNSTYYGEKNILAFGAAGQVQDKVNTGVNLDFLLEKKVGGGGAFTIESEIARYDNLGGYNPAYATDKGSYVLGSYLLPFKTGPGRFEVLGKFAKADFNGGVSRTDPNYSQQTNEINLNYVLKEFDARVQAFYTDTRFNAVLPNVQTVGVGLQLQHFGN